MSRLRPRSREAVPERRRSEAKGAAANRLRRLWRVHTPGGDPLVGFSPSEWGFDSAWQAFVT